MDVSALSADTAHRYRVVGELLRAWGQESALPAPTFLDVGGYPGTFTRTFTAAYPRWIGHTLDTPKEDLPNYTSGSGQKLPFPDQSFDAVVTIDTFEHIPAGDRQAFAAELCRVARHLVILAAPFYHNATATVERLLDQAHEKAFGVPHPWLHEHVQYGLPHLETTLGGWSESFGVTDVVQSYDLMAWTTWQALSLLRKRSGDLDNAWNAFDSASAGIAAPRVGQVPYRYAIVAKRGAKGRTLVPGMFPDPNAGREVIELARLYARMLEGSGAPAAAGSNATPVIEQRLKDALKAAEEEIVRLKGAPNAPAPPAPPPSSASRPSALAIKKLFGKS